MAGQSLVSGTLATYPGASIVARFISQGGGTPAIASAAATLDENGFFTLEAWDNTNAAYAPSQTEFILRSTAGTFYSTTITVAGSSDDISTQLAGAPTPPSATGVPSVNGVANAVTIAGGGGVQVTTSGNTITVASSPVPTLYSITKTISSAQLLAMTTPDTGSIEIVAAPGAAAAILPVASIIQFTPSTTPYTDNGATYGLFPSAAPASAFIANTATAIGATGTVAFAALSTSSAAAAAASAFAGKALEFGLSVLGGGAVTAGNGSLTVQVLYLVVPVA